MCDLRSAVNHIAGEGPHFVSVPLKQKLVGSSVKPMFYSRYHLIGF